jgi:hypothetical protein
MDDRRIVLLTTAVLAIGIFVLPSTMSLFAGQHVWYDLSAGVNEVPCEKCHADVAEEMQSDANGAHRNLTCAMCHRTPFTNYTYASGEGNGSTPGKEAHAAAVIECMTCHGIYRDNGKWSHYANATTKYPEYAECGRCHGGGGWGPSRDHPDFISAGGFGIEDPANPEHTTTDDDTGEKAAHKKFVLDAMNDTTMSGANEACLACHTMIAVKLNWTHARSLEFEVGLDSPVTTETGVHNWTMTNWAVNGTANATVWGNTTGAGNTSYWSEWPGNVDNIYE